jgi:uncharacterized membrane protein YcaP (DUF421 family)
MKPYQIHLEDWQRILLGEVPGAFYIEVIIRAVVIYLILIGSMRIMGRRMASQLSRIEMAAMVSLAAAIGVPIQSPDRGILPAVMIAIVVVGVQRIISMYSARNQKFEDLTQDDLDVLVEDSVMQLDKMKRTRITQDRLCAHLRSEGLTHLGCVQRLYLEANGAFSLVKSADPKPGLCILPAWDEDFVNELEETNTICCVECGKEQEDRRESNKCSNCQASNWTRAVREKKIAKKNSERIRELEPA